MSTVKFIKVYFLAESGSISVTQSFIGH